MTISPKLTDVLASTTLSSAVTPDRKNFRICNHRGGEAFAQLSEIVPERNVVGASYRQVSLHRGDRQDPMMGVLEVSASFVGLDLASRLHENACDDLEAVGDPMLDFP